MKPIIHSYLFLTASVASWTPGSFYHARRGLMPIKSFTFSQFPRRSSNVPPSYSKNASLKAGSDNDITTKNEPTDGDDELLWIELRGEKLDGSSSMPDLTGKIQAASNDDSWTKTEHDFKIYADLLREMETSGEDTIYSNILGDLKSSNDNRENIAIPPAEADADSPLVDDDLTVVDESLMTASVFNDIDGIGDKINGETEMDSNQQDEFSGTEEMMKRALQEALIEVRKTAPLYPASDPKSILNDKEMMKELNSIFDRANDQLLASISEIRQDQVCTAPP